jgi:hypothetical protein
MFSSKQRAKKHNSCRTERMAKRRYSSIRDGLIRHHKALFKKAKARGQTTCPRTGKPLIDLSQERYRVLEALSKKKLLVRDLESESIDEFILTIEKDIFSPNRKSVTMLKAF